MGFLPPIKVRFWRLAALLALFCMLAISPVSPIQPENGEATVFSQIDAYLTSQMAALRLPGISLAIIQGDQIVHSRGFGSADPSGRPMTPQTPMLIGSVSKSITALAVMQLVEAGKIELDAPIQRYLPRFSISPPPDASYAGIDQAPDPLASSRITIRHLLNQTSGLSRAGGEKMMADGDTSDTALERHVGALSTERMSRPAGTGFEYSNANYITLGMVIQAVSGMPYEAYIQENIFKPLEMQHSYPSLAEAQQHGMSAGYRQWFGFPVAAGDLPYPRGMSPAGYLISSAEDLGHYLIALLNQGRYKEVSILSPQGITALHTPAVAAAPEGYHQKPSGSYAMGWYVMEMSGIPVIAHDGDTPNFHADVILIPSEKWGLALLVNTNTVLMGDSIRGLAGGTASLLSGQQPPRIKTDFRSLTLYLFMTGCLAFEIFKLARLAVTWRQPVQQGKKGNAFWFKHLGLPLLVGAAVAYGMFVVLPHMFQVPWKVMLLNQPDLSWVILLVGSLALLNGILQSIQIIYSSLSPLKIH